MILKLLTAKEIIVYTARFSTINSLNYIIGIRIRKLEVEARVAFVEFLFSNYNNQIIKVLQIFNLFKKVYDHYVFRLAFIFLYLIYLKTILFLNYKKLMET